eukprot:6210025-Pleurochrysis_carterae.AAC.2
MPPPQQQRQRTRIRCARICHWSQGEAQAQESGTGEAAAAEQREGAGTEALLDGDEAAGGAGAFGATVVRSRVAVLSGGDGEQVQSAQKQCVCGRASEREQERQDARK